jgi:uncharacterized damage-inducible protein DinB
LGPLLIEAFRYHKWASLHLLGVCATLTDEQLRLTGPGTYGSVSDTLMHLLAAEQRYIKRLGGSEPTLSERGEFPGIESLTSNAARTGDELIAIADRIRPEDKVEAQFSDGQYRLQSGIVLIQALHHGNDHRTHICTILGHHGLTYGVMDVWAYGNATGAIVPIGAG